MDRPAGGRGVAGSSHAELIAIGARSLDKAEVVGQEFDIPLRFGRYEDLVACPDVDVVYIATPHSSHVRDATLALRAGKPVLCKRTLIVNAREPEALIANVPTWVTPDGVEETIQLPHLGNGYPHEAMEVMKCLRSRERERDIMPVD